MMVVLLSYNNDNSYDASILMGLRLITTKEWNTQWCIAQVA
jgi:hypothetical protein